MNILLHIQYIGTNYSGWQSQQNANSIQDAIEEAIYRLSGEKVKLVGSGRTDAGVHALGQRAHFHTGSSIPPEKWAVALNPHLPPDICILGSQMVPQGFHARFDAREKTYLYRIFSGPIQPVMERNRSAFVKEGLDVATMGYALQQFLGTHDFSGFCASGSSTKNNVRTIYSATLKEHPRGNLLWEIPALSSTTFANACDSVRCSDGPEGNLLELIITGEGFLYNMVRILAGTLIEIGKGKPYSIEKALQSGNREDAGPTAPPWGLYLFQVNYKKEKSKW